MLELVRAHRRGSRRRVRAPSRAATSRRRPRRSHRRSSGARLRRLDRERRDALRAIDVDIDVRVVKPVASIGRVRCGVSSDALARRRDDRSARRARPRAWRPSARTAAGFAISSTRRHSFARAPRTPSVVVQKMSARSWRTLRLSVTRVRPPVPGSTPSSGTSGRRHRRRTIVDQQDLVARERELVAAAGARAVDRGEELQARMRGSSPRGRCASRW